MVAVVAATVAPADAKKTVAPAVAKKNTAPDIEMAKPNGNPVCPLVCMKKNAVKH